MIKFSAETGTGRSLFGFGLSRANIDLLIAKKPIKVELTDLGGPTITVVIMFGETDREIFEELQGAGMIHPNVQYHSPGPDETVVMRLLRDSKESPGGGT